MITYLKNFFRGVWCWIKKNGDSLLTIIGLFLQTKAAIVLSQAVFPTGVETGGAGWSTYLTGFNIEIYQSGLHWLMSGLIIQLLAVFYKLLNK